MTGPFWLPSERHAPVDALTWDGPARVTVAYRPYAGRRRGWARALAIGHPSGTLAAEHDPEQPPGLLRLETVIEGPAREVIKGAWHTLEVETGPGSWRLAFDSHQRFVYADADARPTDPDRAVRRFPPRPL